MKKKVRLDQYIQKFNNTSEGTDQISNERELSSPHSAMSDEELRVFLPYMHRQNTFLVTKQIPERKKNLMLRVFLRSKRNQIVEINQFYYSDDEMKTFETYRGKVTAIGRDFVLLTTLRKKRWFPYSQVKSANIPLGVPDYANNYQHVIYDNKLKEKLLKDFSNTVLKRDELVQQFYEESFLTNLKKWRGIHVSVKTINQEVQIGKLSAIGDDYLEITSIGSKKQIALPSIGMIETVSPMISLLSPIRSLLKRR